MGQCTMPENWKTPYHELRSNTRLIFAFYKTGQGINHAALLMDGNYSGSEGSGQNFVPIKALLLLNPEPAKRQPWPIEP